MSYEALKSTILLATQCAVCARKLRDAKSAELGIGPDCRKKHGYDDPSITDENRTKANRLIFLIADAQVGPSIPDAVAELRALGFLAIAQKISERTCAVQIAREGETLIVESRYSESAVAEMRGVPGRRWDKERKVNTFPEASKGALWRAIKRAYPGEQCLTPDGKIVPIA